MYTPSPSPGLSEPHTFEDRASSAGFALEGRFSRGGGKPDLQSNGRGVHAASAATGFGDGDGTHELGPAAGPGEPPKSSDRAYHIKLRKTTRDMGTEPIDPSSQNSGAYRDL